MTPPASPETLTLPEILTEIDGRLQRVEAIVTELAEAWREYQGIAESFARGGILGARTAARQWRRNGDHTT